MRVCNNCKTPFWKEGGCNRIVCTRCRNQQCFVCSIDLEGISGHFLDGGSCPLFDDTVLRLYTEAQIARERTLNQLLPPQLQYNELYMPVGVFFKRLPATFHLVTVDFEALLNHSDLDFPIPRLATPALSISGDLKLKALYLKVAKAFGLEKNQFRLWGIMHRQNKTLRPQFRIPTEEYSCRSITFTLQY